MLEHRAAFMWPDIVGPGVNRQTMRRYVAKGVLHVYVLLPALFYVCFILCNFLMSYDSMNLDLGYHFGAQGFVDTPA